nr:5-deoxy-glucuronate isomerase [Spirochaetales bacterium]
SLELERAWLLIKGEVEFSCQGKSFTASRFSCFDENPEVLHVSAGIEVTVKAVKKSELCVERTENKNRFPSKFYTKEDIKSDVFGAGMLNEASIRTVRTVFDGEIAPESNMVLGEVINHPGKWSSYPPHDHPHPEIYHYRLFPKQGFGVSLLDEDPYVVKDGDSSLIFPDKTHSQVAGAGYAMYYIWMIPNLPGDKWLPTTRYFRDEHKWMLKDNVKIWPERPYTDKPVE